MSYKASANDLVWQSNRRGDEINHPDVEVVGLYSSELLGASFYINASSGEILEIIIHEEEEDMESSELRLSPYHRDLLDKFVDNIEYSYPAGNKTVLCTLTMKDHGFQVTGKAGCVDPKTYVKELGDHYSLEDALNKVDEFVGYQRQIVLAGGVILTKGEYEDLVLSSEKLDRLEAYGVDNWSGYCNAINDTDGIFGEDSE